MLLCCYGFTRVFCVVVKVSWVVLVVTGGSRRLLCCYGLLGCSV